MVLKFLKSLSKPLIDFIYPPCCSFCQSLLTVGKDLLCTTCWNELPIYSLSANIRDEIAEKMQIPVLISQANTVWQFDYRVQHVIHQLKYNHHSWMAYKIALFIAELIQRDYEYSHFDYLIPVPLHKNRQRKRGFNQSQLICNALSKIIHTSVNATALRRIKNTESQTKLNRMQRIQNMENAFVIKENDAIRDKTILLIDDVITTGSTINACAQQLMKSGAKAVYAMSAAKA